MAEVQDDIKRLQEHFGSRLGFLGYQLIMHSQTGQPCDLTFFKRKPILDAIIHERLYLALCYGAGPEKLQELLTDLKLKNGESVNIGDIWTINPMPKDGFKQEVLDAVDVKQEGQEQIGPAGETLRKMISETYQCKSTEEEDNYIRRWVAS